MSITGKILHVDLSKKRTWNEEIGKELLVDYLGGRGINARLLWDHVRKPGIDPLSPENVLIFGAGLLNGTSAPSAGRSTVTCKSPTSDLITKTNMGGHWGSELKFAGYSHLVIHGASKTPVYVSIINDYVEIRDAYHIWGKDVRATTIALKEELHDRDTKVAVIGQAGENLVRAAAVMSSVYHAAARAGPGAVMGSKRLKAIAVRGTKPIVIAEPEKFHELALNIRTALANDSIAQALYRLGTSSVLLAWNERHLFPSYNFRSGHIENVYPLSGENLIEKGYLRRRVGCFSCTVSCHRYTEVNTGPYSGAYSGGPEYETLGSLGAGTGVTDTESILKANELCNAFGLDTISTGSAIQFAMECYENGLLNNEDTDGLELKFGNSEALVRLVRDIALRRGKLGNMLAEGVYRASKVIGGESWKWAIVNSKKLEQSRIETRAAKGFGLGFAVNPRGPDHLHTCPCAESGWTPESRKLVKELTGDEKYAVPYSTEFKAEIVRYHEDFYSVCDALGFCFQIGLVAFTLTPKHMAELFSYTTGIPINEKEILFAGRRILTLEKCFNVREGADRKLDDLPWRLMNEPAPPGPAEGLMNSREELDQMLDRYYELHEWDIKTSWPYRETLEKLNLGYVSDELRKYNKLPNRFSRYSLSEHSKKRLWSSE